MSTPKTPSRDTNRTNRKTLTYIGTVVLLIVVVVAFVGAPALTGTASSNRLTFGEYDGDEITYTAGNYFARQYQGLAQQVQQQDQQITDLLVRQIWLAAFQRTVLHEALMDLAEEAGASVSVDEIDRAIAQWPEFVVDGRFSTEEYSATSSQYQLALRQYLEQSLINTRVQSDFLASTDLSEPEREFLASMAGPERQFEFVSFDFAQFPAEEVLAYGEENLQRFSQINLSVITVNSSETDAQSIREQAVNRTSTFEDLARNQSSDSFASEGGEVGWTFYHSLEPDFESTSTIDEIFALGVGEISPVLRTTFGWTIYRVNEAAIPADLDDEETLGEIRNYVQIFERGLVEDYLTGTADAFVLRARTEDFAAAAASVDQQPQLTGYFPVNYGNSPYLGTVTASSNQTVSNGAFDQDFLVSLFSLEAGETTDPIVLRDSVFVFRLADERSENPDTGSFFESYLPFIVQEYAQSDLPELVIDDGKLVDNFNSAYNRFILGQ